MRQRRTQARLRDEPGTAPRHVSIIMTATTRAGANPPGFRRDSRAEQWKIAGPESCQWPTAMPGQPLYAHLPPAVRRKQTMNESLDQPAATDPSPAQPAATPCVRRPTDRRPRAGPTSRRQPSQFLTVFPPIMLPMFLAVADQTIVATALPAIASSLGEIERASWVVVSYLIANTIAAPVYGRLGDTFGRRLMMVVALDDLHGRLGAVRARAQYRTAYRVPGAAGFRRRRLDDAVASADRRSDPAARARPLSGLSRRHLRSVPAPSARSPAAI